MALRRNRPGGFRSNTGRVGGGGTGGGGGGGQQQQVDPALQAVRRQFGLIQNAPGYTGPDTGGFAGYHQGTMADANSMFTNPQSPNYRPPGGTGMTPINIGGMRMFWNDQTQSLEPTGQRSDLAGGNAYNAATQVPYGRGGGAGGGGQQRVYPEQPGTPGFGGRGPLGLGQGGLTVGAGGTGIGGVTGDRGIGAIGTPPAFLPSSPAFEAGRRNIEDQLAHTLAKIGVSEQEIPALTQMFLARLGTEQSQAEESLDENLIGRNIYHSGIRNRDVGRLRGGFERRRQDFGNEQGRALSGLGEARGEAQLGANQGLANLLLQLAGDQSSNLPIFLPQYGGQQQGQQNQQPRRQRPRNRNRNRNR